MIVGHQEGAKKRTLRGSPDANTWSESRRRPCEPLRTGCPSNAGLLMAGNRQPATGNRQPALSMAWISLGSSSISQRSSDGGTLPLFHR